MYAQRVPGCRPFSQAMVVRRRINVTTRKPSARSAIAPTTEAITFGPVSTGPEAALEAFVAMCDTSVVRTLPSGTASRPTPWRILTSRPKGRRTSPQQRSWLKTCEVFPRLYCLPGEIGPCALRHRRRFRSSVKQVVCVTLAGSSFTTPISIGIRVRRETGGELTATRSRQAARPAPARVALGMRV